MKPQKWKLTYLVIILISIILIMLSYTPKIQTVEIFDNKNNNILGGAIVTLQNEFTKLLAESDKLEKNIENVYSLKDLSGNINDLSGNSTTISNLYNKLQSIKSSMYAFIDTDILQPASTTNTNSKQIITNKNIKTDARWPIEVIPLLTQLKSDFTVLLAIITQYLAIIPDPLPDYITKEQKEIVDILRSMQHTIKMIDQYIIDAMKS